MDKLLADDALDALGVIQNELPYGIAGTIGYALAKLKEYEQAEQEGLLVKLPCKVGDTVCEVVSDGFMIPSGRLVKKIVERKFSLSMLDNTNLLCFKEFDKTVFLTKQDAEKALEREEELCD